MILKAKVLKVRDTEEEIDGTDLTAYPGRLEVIYMAVNCTNEELKNNLQENQHSSGFASRISELAFCEDNTLIDLGSGLPHDLNVGDMLCFDTEEGVFTEEK